jgi:hypothetical protein
MSLLTAGLRRARGFLVDFIRVPALALLFRVVGIERSSAKI